MDFKQVQNKTNLTNEFETSYFEDVIEYFERTIPLVEDYMSTESNQDEIFDTIGLLQTIYIQQDLIDEMLYVFRIDQSRNEDKNPNREIRNELVGHPINRDEFRVLKSTVFYGNRLTKNKIHYIRYSREKEFLGVEVEWSTQEIINQHINFLNKYFDIILIKLKRILKKLSNDIGKIIEISKNVSFFKLLEILEIRFKIIFEQKEIYSKDVLLEIEKVMNRHTRYKYSYDLFLKEFPQYILEKQNYITSLRKIEKSNDYEKKENKTIEIEVIGDNSVMDNSNNLFYELGKLSSNHPIWGIEYFKENYGSNKILMDELINMEQNFPYKDECKGELVDNIKRKMEFFCSYEYIRNYLLNNEG